MVSSLNRAQFCCSPVKELSSAVDFYSSAFFVQLVMMCTTTVCVRNQLGMGIVFVPRGHTGFNMELLRSRARLALLRCIQISHFWLLSFSKQAWSERFSGLWFSVKKVNGVIRVCLIKYCLWNLGSPSAARWELSRVTATCSLFQQVNRQWLAGFLACLVCLFLLVFLWRIWDLLLHLSQENREIPVVCSGGCLLPMPGASLLSCRKLWWGRGGVKRCFCACAFPWVSADMLLLAGSLAEALQADHLHLAVCWQRVCSPTVVQRVAVPGPCCVAGWPSAGAACCCHPSLVPGLQPCPVLAHLSGPLAAWGCAVVCHHKLPLGAQAWPPAAVLHGPTSPFCAAPLGCGFGICDGKEQLMPFIFVVTWRTRLTQPGLCVLMRGAVITWAGSVAVQIAVAEELLAEQCWWSMLAVQAPIPSW